VIGEPITAREYALAPGAFLHIRRGRLDVFSFLSSSLFTPILYYQTLYSTLLHNSITTLLQKWLPPPNSLSHPRSPWSTAPSPPPPTTKQKKEPSTPLHHHPTPDPRNIWERPQKITINAGRKIKGVGNLVSPASLSALSEAKLFSTTLLAVISQLNNSAGAGGRRRRLNVDLTINCGITVVGHKNVVGIPMRRNAEGKFTPSASEATVVEAAVAGAKRKADNDEVSSVLFCSVLT
jgi:hypothetical protein